LYGPLLDKFGRKKPLYFGLALYIVSFNRVLFFDSSLQMLIIMRFFEAIGGCAASVAAMTMVRDLFPVKDNAKVFAIAHTGIGCFANAGTYSGQLHNAGFEWQVIFLVLTIIAALILLCCIFLFARKLRARSYVFA
jgi:DHA1 family bicyclomycin/chloramphenicol resistance-like MFS transporter